MLRTLKTQQQEKKKTAWLKKLIKDLTKEGVLLHTYTVYTSDK